VSKDKTQYYHHKRHFSHHKCSCDSYWQDAFLSEVDFKLSEDYLLDKFNYIGETVWYDPKPKVTFLGFEYGAENVEGGYIYTCKTCAKLWELSPPENAYRGYFKGVNLREEEMKKYLKLNKK